MHGRKPITMLSIGIAIAGATASHPAFAISADLAKKCRDMAIKAHPFDIAGSKTGSAAAERSYFNECVAKGGNMPESRQEDSGKSGDQGTPAGSSK
jgi:hypothetical protein